MVKTANDVMDINPLERMNKLDDITNEKKGSIAAKKKELEEFEKDKKRENEELDQKKRKELEELAKKKQKDLEELDKKRKELADLESKKLKEIEETQRLIDQSFQELMRHKKQLLQEADEEIKKQRKNKEEKETTLEDVANTAPSPIVPLNNNQNYGKFFENLQQPQRFYDVTNNNFYAGLAVLRNKAATGQITPEEELFVEKLRNQFEQFNNNQVYIDQDQNQYLKRSLNIIDQIGKYQRLKID